jgi:ATP-dependent Clp protease ATP-binding subunit ClpX
MVALTSKFFLYKSMAKEKIRMLILRKKKPDTSLLIAGIDAHICDKCIEQAHGIVLEELKSTGSSKLAGDLILKKKKLERF